MKDDAIGKKVRNKKVDLKEEDYEMLEENVVVIFFMRCLRKMWC